MTVTILIVEDNPVAGAFLARVVTESFQDIQAITTATDLRSARRLLGRQAGAQNMPLPDGNAAPVNAPSHAPFRVILIDLDLPDGSGLALLQELHDYPATRIVTTHYADDEQLLPALQAGADGYLLKEERFELLVEELQRIVRHQPSLAPSLARQVLQLLQPSQSLSAIEADVLTQLSKGLSTKEVARQLDIKWLDVYGHIQTVYGKLSAS